MTTVTSITELKRMSAAELRKELASKRAAYARHRIGVTMQSEKNHAACRLLRREIARMTMVLSDLEKTERSTKHSKKVDSAESVSSNPSVSSGSSTKKPVKGVRSKSEKAA